MNIVLQMLCAIGAIACLCIFTFACAFYHSYESNREKFDNYSLFACAFFGIGFVILFRLAVM